MALYSRNSLGYGEHPPDPQWPNDAFIAVQFVLHYNEESSDGYGVRAGFWRLYRVLMEKKIAVTVYGVASALFRSPKQFLTMQDAGWEIGLQINESEKIKEDIHLHRLITGQSIVSCSTKEIDHICEEEELEYAAHGYDDDLPYWYKSKEKVQLIIPYTLENTDVNCTGERFFTKVKDCFNRLYEEGKSGSAKMMTIELHNSHIGRPGLILYLIRLIDYIANHEKVWIPSRIDLARHWKTKHPYRKADLIPSELTREEFVSRFGSIFEHSSWIAERTFDDELSPANDTAIGLHFVLRKHFRGASEEDRLQVLIAHPDLAGKLALAKRLTVHSTDEQSSAGLDMLTDEERKIFTELNQMYTEKFSFPFIIAVKDNTKQSILQAFQRRLGNDRQKEFETACAQVERIAFLRLKSLLPE